MPTLIHPSKAGFNQGRSATSNIRKVLTVLEFVRTNPTTETSIIALDAKKSFDNVSF